jgi:5,10-methylenetetrahydromethanopterin reductase
MWTTRTPEIGTAEHQAGRAERAGWDGITFTDSQNLVGDPFVATALAARATERLRFATGVANLFTRHPAALATIAATVGEESGGRFVLGVGRGDTALFHLGHKPMPVAQFGPRLTELQAYLAGETVDQRGHPSRLQWLDRARQPKVPLDVAASGPRVIALAARTAERVTFAVGADPDRLAWALDLARTEAAAAGRDPADLSFGAYVNVGCHPDLATARGLIAGGVAAFAHFSAMPGSTGAGLGEADRAVVADVGRRYYSNVHLRNSAEHTEPLADAFVDRFAIVGPPERCVARLTELAGLGIERFVVTGPTFGADRDAARAAGHLLAHEVLPAAQHLVPRPAGAATSARTVTASPPEPARTETARTGPARTDAHHSEGATA